MRPKPSLVTMKIVLEVMTARENPIILSKAFKELVGLTNEYTSQDDPSSLTFGVFSSAFSEYLSVLRIARPEDVNCGWDSCKVKVSYTMI